MSDTYKAWYDSLERQDTPEAEAYRLAAKEIHQVEGEVEVDDNAVVSFSDDGGAYVMAWVWVNAACEHTKDGEDDGERDCPNCIDGVHYSDPAVAEQHRKDSDSAKEPAS